MATNFKINLAKDLTSSPEQRAHFYNGMLIYLALSTVALVFVAYLSSVNIRRYLENKQERRQLLQTAAAMYGLDALAFKDPQTTYAGLEAYSRRIASLKQALTQRVQLLPIIHNLFVELPEGIALQSLSADRSKLLFGLVMPAPSEEAGDPVRELRTAWEENEELMTRVATIRPTTGERRTMGAESMFFVQFECVFVK
ncbi:MAG: hypothetical protein OES84_03750 [Kiritimatiellaceae bacterium]|nr:hypothetical protein [Kiritimatiellaceae bacterium]